MTEYRTAQDIIIPAGTKCSPAPVTVARGTEHVSVILGPSKDTHAEWVMDLEDALETGMVEEVKEEEAA